MLPAQLGVYRQFDLGENGKTAELVAADAQKRTRSFAMRSDSRAFRSNSCETAGDSRMTALSR